MKERERDINILTKILVQSLSRLYLLNIMSIYYDDFMSFDNSLNSGLSLL